MILKVDGDHNNWFCGGGSKIEVVKGEKLDLFLEKRRSQWLPSTRGLGRIQGSTSKGSPSTYVKICFSSLNSKTGQTIFLNF
jgi:hypothetical protein